MTSYGTIKTFKMNDRYKFNFHLNLSLRYHFHLSEIFYWKAFIFFFFKYYTAKITILYGEQFIRSELAVACNLSVVYEVV